MTKQPQKREHGIKHSIIRASVGEMRAVLMACLAAGLGLLPLHFRMALAPRRSNLPKRIVLMRIPDATVCGRAC